MIKPGFKAILAQEDRDVVDAMDFFPASLNTMWVWETKVLAMFLHPKLRFKIVELFCILFRHMATETPDNVKYLAPFIYYW